jgi:signal transduction histidine kinase
VFNPRIAASLISDQLKIESEKIKLQEELSEEHKKKDQSAAREQRSINLFFFSIILALSAVSVLFYRNADVKRRLNLRLKEKQEEILAQAEELKAQTEELRASNEKIEAINANLEDVVNERTTTIKNQNLRLRDYAYFNAHKVRGPLARIMGLISIVEYEFPHEGFGPYVGMLKASSNELDKAIREINIVLEGEE